MAKKGFLLKLIPILFASLIIFFFFARAKNPLDLYNILGVDRSASRRDIQKAFHKLSLQYHPDKNKSKGAKEKFVEINNAYDTLSDEQKRKNYDLYADERNGPSFGGGNAGGYGGYSYSQGQGKGKSRPSSRSFSFFGGRGSGGNPFGFGLNDIFSNLFGGGSGGGSSSQRFSGSHFGDSRNSAGSKSGFKSSSKSVQNVNSQLFEKEINEKGITWLFLSYTSSTMSTEQYESIFEEVGKSLKGALKVGKINCEDEPSFCKIHRIYPSKAPGLFVYSYITIDGGSFVAYNDDWEAKSLKSFCQKHLPGHSRRISLVNFEPSFSSGVGLPRVMLLSTKKYTSAIWRTLSGMYRKRFIFYDAQVHDLSDPKVKRLGVNALPAIVCWLSNGEKQILKAGISVKDLESAVQELGLLLDDFEKKNKKIASSQKTSKSESSTEQIPHLTSSNFDSLCGEETPVCIIGAFRSPEARDKLESILLMVSQKSLSRRRNLSSDSKDSISYTLLDATKQKAFLEAFDKSRFKSSGNLLVAYKPRRGKYASFTGDLNAEEAEKFIGSVLSGDVQFTNIRKKPKVKQ